MPEVWFPHLNIQIQHLPRVAFTIFGFEIYWYGLMIFLAFFTGWQVALAEAKRTGQNPDIYTDYLFYALIFSIIGARLFYVIFDWEIYKDDLLKIFAFREGGLAVYGGTLAAAATAYVFTRAKKINFAVFADTAVFGMVFGQVIGRLGNFFNREAFGGFTDSLLAMRYLASTVGFIPDSAAEVIIEVNGAQYIQVHPTFLYEVLWNLGLFFFLHYYKKRKAFTGELIFIYMVGYGIGRFWIEGLRTDSLMLFNTGLRASQALSVVLVAAGVVAMIYGRIKNRRTSNE